MPGRLISLDPSDIVVAVEDGVVKLSETVRNREERLYAESLALSVFAVEDVDNDISIRKVH